MKLLLLSGLSGSGKSIALHHLEDEGAYCVDHLPAELLRPLVHSFGEKETAPEYLAVCIDARCDPGMDMGDLIGTVQSLRKEGIPAEIICLEASDEALLNRFKEKRRDHPLCREGLSIREAIREERSRLKPLFEAADHVLDTSRIPPRLLQTWLDEQLRFPNAEDSLKVEVLSFGYKHGLPAEADLLLDVRFLPNPFYIPELRSHSGLEEEVRDFVLQNELTREFLEKTLSWLCFLLPNYRREGKKRLVIGVGCTGGMHRSVALAEQIGQSLRAKGYPVSISHRDIALEKEYCSSPKE